MRQISRGGASQMYAYNQRCTIRLRDPQHFVWETHGFRIAKHRDRSQVVRGGRLRAFLHTPCRSFNAPRDFQLIFLGFRVARRKP